MSVAMDVRRPDATRVRANELDQTIESAAFRMNDEMCVDTELGAADDVHLDDRLSSRAGGHASARWDASVSASAVRRAAASSRPARS